MCYLQHEQINMREAKEVADSSILTLEGFALMINLTIFGQKRTKL
jgi:hypothetical protein